jgi:hypothetical protein
MFHSQRCAVWTSDKVPWHEETKPLARTSNGRRMFRSVHFGRRHPDCEDNSALIIQSMLDYSDLVNGTRGRMIGFRFVETRKTRNPDVADKLPLCLG